MKYLVRLWLIRPDRVTPAHKIFHYRCFLPNLAEFAETLLQRPHRASLIFKSKTATEREGFEPSERVNVHTLSRRAPST